MQLIACNQLHGRVQLIQPVILDSASHVRTIRDLTPYSLIRIVHPLPYYAVGMGFCPCGFHAIDAILQQSWIRTHEKKPIKSHLEFIFSKF